MDELTGDVVELFRVLRCRLFGHKWEPHESPVGWKNVKFCPRCKQFNPMNEWVET